MAPPRTLTPPAKVTIKHHLRARGPSPALDGSGKNQTRRGTWEVRGRREPVLGVRARGRGGRLREAGYRCGRERQGDGDRPRGRGRGSCHDAMGRAAPAALYPTLSSRRRPPSGPSLAESLCGLLPPASLTRAPSDSSGKATSGLALRCRGGVSGWGCRWAAPSPPPTNTEAGSGRVGGSLPPPAPQGGPWLGCGGACGVLTGLGDHTVLVSWGALHQRLAVLVATAHVTVKGPGWGEEAGTPVSVGWGEPGGHVWPSLSLRHPPFPPEVLPVPGDGARDSAGRSAGARGPWDGGGLTPGGIWALLLTAAAPL